MRISSREARGPLTRVVRSATTFDAAAVATVQVQSWRQAYAGIFPDRLLASLPAAAWTAGWRRRIASAPKLGLWVDVAEGAQGLVGFCCIGRSELDAGGPDTAELHTLYVDPSSWRTGTGSHLVRGALDHVRQDRYRSAIAWVVTQNQAARRFYEASGWRWDGASMVGDLWEVGGEMAHYQAVRYRVELE